MVDDLRFILVAVHRGQVARALQAEYKKHGAERFQMHCAQLAPRVWTHVSRLGTGTHYRILPAARPMLALELREVERLWWPEGAQIDARTWRERKAARRRRM